MVLVYGLLCKINQFLWYFLLSGHSYQQNSNILAISFSSLIT